MKHIIWVLLVFAGMSYASAQDVYTSSGKPGYHKKNKKVKGYDPSKLVIGGGLTAGFGDGYVAAGISPIVGYRFAENFVAGVGLGYMYYQNPDPNFSPPYWPTTYYDKENIVTPNLWARYFVWRGLYIAGNFQYNFINLSQPNFDPQNGAQVDQEKMSVIVPCLLIGPGYRMSLGGRASVFFEFVYDVLQQPYSPYLNQPVLMGGIAVGL